MSLDCPWTLSHSHLTVTLTLPFMRLLLLSNSHCFDISLFLLANDLCLFKILPLTSLHTDTEVRMTPAFFSRKHVFSENFGLHYVLPPWLHTTQTDDCFDPANRDHDMNKNQFCQWHWSWQWCDLVIALGALSVPVILIWLALLTYQILQYLNKPLFQKKKKDCDPWPGNYIATDIQLLSTPSLRHCTGGSIFNIDTSSNFHQFARLASIWIMGI